MQPHLPDWEFFTSSDSSKVDITGNVATLISGGTVQITANQGGNSVYDAAPAVTQNLTVIDDTLQTQTILGLKTCRVYLLAPRMRYDRNRHI